MAFIIVDNPEANIWEDNPSLGIISEFKKFRESEGEERSSNILKAIYYIWDPKSDLRDSGISHEKLLEDVTTNIIKDPDFDWDKYDYMRELYMEFNITTTEKFLLRYEKEINDLDVILKDWPWDKKNIRDRADAVRQYKSLLEEYVKFREEALAEAEELNELYGGYTKSMFEDFGN